MAVKIDFSDIKVKNLSVKESRVLYANIKKNKSIAAKLRYRNNKLKKKEGLTKEEKKEIYNNHQKINKANTEWQTSKNVVRNETEFEFANTTVKVKNGYIKKLKNPQKYIFGKVTKTTKRQIKKLRKEGKNNQADGLQKTVNVLLQNNPKLRKDLNEGKKEKKEKGKKRGVQDYISKLLDEDTGEEEEEEEEDDDETPIIFLIQSNLSKVKISNIR